MEDDEYIYSSKEKILREIEGIRSNFSITSKKCFDLINKYDENYFSSFGVRSEVLNFVDDSSGITQGLVNLESKIRENMFYKKDLDFFLKLCFRAACKIGYTARIERDYYQFEKRHQPKTNAPLEFLDCLGYVRDCYFELRDIERMGERLNDFVIEKEGSIVNEYHDNRTQYNNSDGGTQNIFDNNSKQDNSVTNYDVKKDESTTFNGNDNVQDKKVDNKDNFSTSKEENKSSNMFQQIWKRIISKIPWF